MATNKPLTQTISYLETDKGPMAILHTNDDETVWEWYADGKISLPDVERMCAEIDAGGMVEMPLGFVKQPPTPIQTTTDGRHAPSSGELNLATIQTHEIPPLAMGSGNVTFHTCELAIPCVNSDCDGMMRLRIKTNERSALSSFFHWRSHPNWTLDMYFQCYRCHTRTDQRCRSDTGSMIAEGLFALRVRAR